VQHHGTSLLVVVGTRSRGRVTVGPGTGELDGGDIVVVVGEVGLGPPLPGGVEVDDVVGDGVGVAFEVVDVGLAARPPEPFEFAPRTGDGNGRCWLVSVAERLAGGDDVVDGDGGPPGVRVVKVGGGSGRPRSSWPWLAA
jgi:hypothetical protein